MTYIPAQQTKAMVRELAMIKQAAPTGRVLDYLRSGYGAAMRNPWVSRGMDAGGSMLQSGYGAQMAAGAGIGAIGGAATAEKGNRVGSALRGAGIGAGLAGARALATQGGRQALSNFGARQRYYLTGHGVKDVKKAREIGVLPKKIKTTEGSLPKKEHGAMVKKLKEQAFQKEMFEKGMLHAPGTVGNLLSKPGWTMKQGWKRSGLLGKGFLGLGAYETGTGLARKPEPGGPGRMEAGLRGAGGAVGWLVAPQAMLPGMAVGMGGSYFGGKVGKGADMAAGAVQRARRPAPVRYRGNQ